MITEIKKDISRLATSLLEEIESDIEEITIYALFDIYLDPNEQYYEWPQTVSEMEKLGLLEILSKRMGEKIDLAHSPINYKVLINRQNLIQYLIKEENNKIKEPYGFNKQVSIVSNDIVEKLLRLDRENKVKFSKADIIEQHQPHIQLPKVIDKLVEQKLVKVKRVDFIDDNFEFQLDVTDLYREYEVGGNLFTPSQLIGNKAFNIDEFSLKYKWGKVKGKFNKRSSNLLRLLLYFLKHPDEWIDSKTIGKEVYFENQVPPSDSDIENTVGNLRKQLGLSGDTKERPGNIIRDKNRYKLCLQPKI